MHIYVKYNTQLGPTNSDFDYQGNQDREAVELFTSQLLSQHQRGFQPKDIISIAIFQSKIDCWFPRHETVLLKNKIQELEQIIQRLKNKRAAPIPLMPQPRTKIRGIKK